MIEEKLKKLFISENIELPDSFFPFLEYLEQIIPENSKENFRRNLKSLKFKISDDFIHNSNADLPTGNYRVSTNELWLSKKGLISFWNFSKKSSDPREFYTRLVNEVILHELLHMASSRYNPLESISICGYSMQPFSNISELNQGLTEGMTEFLTNNALPSNNILTSSYLFEFAIICQLALLIDKNILLDSYFANKGTKEIQKELLKYIADEEKASQLFIWIEDSYYLRNSNIKQPYLAMIQDCLLDYLSIKLDKCSKEETAYLLNLYSKFLIVEDTIILCRKLPENYVGLKENLNHFMTIKEKYLLEDSLKK